MIDINKAEQIRGWMSTNELIWLAEQAQSAKMIVEVGCFVGRSTRAIADNTHGKLICIDDFYGARDAVIPHSERQTLLKQFEQNFQDSVTAQRKRLCIWKIIHASTLNLSAAPYGPDFRADFIFIDGHHEYPNVYHDISVWLPFVQDGELISGHNSVAYSGVSLRQ